MSYTYPKISENKLRSVCGGVHFSGVKLTGSKEGIEKQLKMLLLQVYNNTIISELEKNVVRRFDKGGQ